MVFGFVFIGFDNFDISSFSKKILISTTFSYSFVYFHRYMVSCKFLQSCFRIIDDSLIDYSNNSICCKSGLYLLFVFFVWQDF